MQDPNPLPWGAQDRFQAHFIVRKDLSESDRGFFAETKLTTKGHFGSKKLIGVQWLGGRIADVLNNDTELTNMILKQSVKDANIRVDPTKNDVRIYGKWKSSSELGMTKDLFAIYDKIASHIKNL